MKAVPSRPDRLLVVCGTSTEVGKTWVAAGLARQLRRRGLRVAARKPLQSFATEDETTDADQLAAATGEDPLEICPLQRRYPLPLAPPMAALALNRPLPTTAGLVTEIEWPSEIGDGTASVGSELIGIVELVGGVCSPHTADGDGADLIRALAPDQVILVAHAELGTINAVRLSAHVLDGRTLIVHLNRFDADEDLHRLNLHWLRDRCGLTVTTSIESLAASIP